MPDRIATRLKGLVAIEPTVHADERGFLIESYREDDWAEFGIEGPFVQENHSRSIGRGILRGLHFQTHPGQAKLVRCTRGEIFDVAVDLRSDSSTFGQWDGHVLDDVKHRQFWIPAGFAHGFQVLSDVADVSYKLTSLYDSETEKEIAWNDPEVGVKWRLEKPILSVRDQNAPPLSEVRASLPF